MRGTLAWCILAGFGLAASGCGSVVQNPDASGDDTPGDDTGPDPDDGAQSGTRLKLQWIDFGGTRVGGSEAHDTTTDFDCYPRLWDDDAYYCTPDSGSVVYSDAACTAAVAYHYSDATCPSDPPTYFVEYGFESCNDSKIRRVYRRGAQVGLTQYYQQGSDGSCQGPYAADSSLVFYAVGTQLGRGQLVAMTRVNGDVGDRYAQGFYESTDGARLFDHVVDTQLAVGCYFQSGTDGPEARCVPETSYYAGYYSDSVCETPAAAATAACDPPQYLAQYPSTECSEDYQPRFFTAGAALDAVYSGSAAACSAVTIEPTLAYYGAGTELTFPTLTRTIDTDGGRQIQLGHYSDGAIRLRANGTFDTTHDIRCYTVPAATGDGYTCIPYSVGLSTYFSDAACTTPIDVAEIYHPAACDPPVVPSVATRYVSGCPGHYEMFAVGASYDAPVYYQPGDGTCAEYSTTNVIRYRIGDRIPDEDFGAGTVVYDP